MKDDKNSLDELNQDLYKRDQAPRRPRAWSRFTKKRDNRADDWRHEHKQLSDPTRVHQSDGMGLPMKLFIFSVVFFVIALSIAAFIIVRGSNLVSSENIDISVTGPVLVEGGKVLSLQIDIVNRNNAALELVDLIVEFPEGTRSATNADEILQRTRESLGDLKPGALISRTVPAVLFGEENSEQEISIGVEYRVADSNAIFFKEKVFVVQIGTAPISLIVDMPTEVISGDEIDLVVEVLSNTSETIENVALSVEYPFGFLFDSAQPKPDGSNNLWLIGDLEPQGRRTIRIAGKIEGQDEEERTFRFIGGLVRADDIREVDTALLVARRTLVIERPFLQADLVLDGRTDDTHVVLPADSIVATVRWQNNLTVPVENVVITAHIDGDVLDEKSVRVVNGFYRSIDNTIIWDKTREPALARLVPGARGDFTFDFASRSPSAALFKNGTLDITVTISGERTGDTTATTGEVSSSVRKTVQIQSDARLLSRAVYSIGPFENVGPIPPRVEQETTYTIIWSLSNASNDLAGVEVSAALPGYMSWTGAVNPSDESVTFNAASSEIRWQVDQLSAGVGYTTPPREVAFQVQLLPSVSQVGSAPILVGAARLEGRDVFTDTSVQYVSRELTTNITADPAYTIGNDRVVE